jgi:acetate kinase
MTKESSIKPRNPRVLTINGGSSTIKFALYQIGEPLERRPQEKGYRIGLSGTNLTFNHPTWNRQDSPTVC